MSGRSAERVALGQELQQFPRARPFVNYNFGGGSYVTSSRSSRRLMNVKGDAKVKISSDEDYDHALM